MINFAQLFDDRLKLAGGKDQGIAAGKQDIIDLFVIFNVSFLFN